jgi:hypothetical protein
VPSNDSTIFKGGAPAAGHSGRLWRGLCSNCLFCFESGAALATVVGVLIEVPVMLSVVYLVKSSQGWYEEKA